MRVYRALVALALQGNSAQSIFSLDAAFRDLVTDSNRRLLAQLPAGGDVSSYNRRFSGVVLQRAAMDAGASRKR